MPGINDLGLIGSGTYISKIKVLGLRSVTYISRMKVLGLKSVTNISILRLLK